MSIYQPLKTIPLKNWRPAGDTLWARPFRHLGRSVAPSDSWVHWSITFRWFAIGFMMLGVILFQRWVALAYPIKPVLWLGLVQALLNAGYQAVVSARLRVPGLALVQIILDLTAITLIVQYTGGVDSPFHWFYLLVIIIVGLLHGPKAGLAAAVSALVMFASVIALQYYHVLPHVHVGLISTHDAAGFKNFTLMRNLLLVDFLLFFGVAATTGWVITLIEENRRVQWEYVLQQQLLARTLESQEELRQRIARDIHNEYGQTLTALMVHLDLLEESIASDKVAVPRKLGYLKHLAEKAIQHTQKAVFSLRPTLIDDFGLVATVGRTWELTSGPWVWKPGSPLLARRPGWGPKTRSTCSALFRKR